MQKTMTIMKQSVMFVFGCLMIILIGEAAAGRSGRGSWRPPPPPWIHLADNLPGNRPPRPRHAPGHLRGRDENLEYDGQLSRRERNGDKDKREQHFCITDSRPIPPHKMCDGKFDCRDLSDEYLCPTETVTNLDGLYQIFNATLHNMSKLFISRNMIGLDGTRLSLISNTGKRRESALDFIQRSCISSLDRTIVANGKQATACTYCNEGEILCSLEFSSNGTMECVSKNQVCDGIQQCPDNQDEIFCDIMRERPTGNCTKNSNFNRFIRNKNRNNSERMKKIKERHNATISCMTLANVFSVNNVRKKEWGRTGSPHGGYSFSRQSATRMQLLSKVLLQTKTLNNATDNQKNITLSQVCDGIIDCDSAHDELICPGRFYCESGTPLYVNSSQRGDEVADCDDGSDEWEDRPGRMTSSKDKMIKDWYILFSMWVVGIVAVLGNSVVIINTSLSLTTMQNTRSSSAVLQLLSSVTGVIFSDSGIKRGANLKRDDKGNINQRRTGKSVGWGRKKTIKLWNSVLVLNLAAADFLMGIYLVTLAGISMTQSTDYWNFDKKWRTSGPCQALGVIVMLSSQTSVLSLISLTTLRLYSVARPFGMRILKKSNYLICICAATWIVSFATAVLPILPGLRDHYTTKAWVPFPHARPPVINQTTASNLILAMIDVSENTTIGANLLKGEHLSWREMVDLTKQAAPMYSDWRFFGFYSVHSVCIPKLYVTIGDVAWQHTATFLIVNFVGVVYISIAYLFIYILSNKSRAVVFEKAPTRLDESVHSSKNCSPNTSIESVQEGDRGKLWIFRDCFTCHKRRQSNFAPTTPCNDRENVKKVTQRTSKIQFRIALLIATDCVCWIPICIMGFLKLAGHDIPYVAYTISAVGLLPVNSALNPLLYSSFLNDFRIRFYNTLKKKVVTVHVDK